MSVVGGKLKFKGGTPKTKKPKKPSREESDSEEDISKRAARKKQEKKEEERRISVALSEYDKKTSTSSSSSQEVESQKMPIIQISRKTESQLAHEAKVRAQEKKLLKGDSLLPYRQRVEKYNQRLGELSEHHDIPKVGPG